MAGIGTTNGGFVSIGYGSTPRDQATCLGIGATADFPGESVINNGAFATYGDCKVGLFTSRMTTTNATPTEVGTTQASVSGVGTAPTQRIACSLNSTYLFDCHIVARNTGSAGNAAAWTLQFAINVDGTASTTAISSLVKSQIYTVGTTTGWDVTATADTTNGRPNISVTGAAATTIRWVCSIRMTKVSN